MSTGGLQQLVAYGAQDLYLTYAPTLTFFKVEYERHTHFAMSDIRQTFQGSADLGRESDVVLTRSGDLVTRLTLEVTLPALCDDDAATYFDIPEVLAPNVDKVRLGYTNSVANAIVREVELQIGGQKIDKQYGEFWHMVSEIALPRSKWNAYRELTGTVYTREELYARAEHEQTVSAPHWFFFNNNTGLALPLIALQYHEVRLQYTFRPIDQLIIANFCPQCPTLKCKPQCVAIELWAEYVFLDSVERRMFAQFPHEMLIETTQRFDSAQVSGRNQLNFQHPTKALFFAIYREDRKNANDWFNVGPRSYKDELDHHVGSAAPFLKSANMQINGQDRWTDRRAIHWGIEEYFYRTRGAPEGDWYMMAFAIRPLEYQPSGTINFSRIDQAYLTYRLNSPYDDGQSCTINGCSVRLGLVIYTIQYNVLRVTNGMAGLAFAS